jgi:hypothetical protein
MAHERGATARRDAVRSCAGKVRADIEGDADTEHDQAEAGQRGKRPKRSGPSGPVSPRRLSRRY